MIYPTSPARSGQPNSKTTSLQTDLPVQTSESAVPIPIVYGTARIAGNLLERDGPWNPAFVGQGSSGNGMGTGKGGAVEVHVADASGQIIVDYYAGWTHTGVYDAGTGRLIPTTDTPFDLTTNSSATPFTVSAGIYVFPGRAGHRISIYYEYDFSSQNVGEPLTPGYISDLVIGLCEGPIQGFGRVWQDRQSFPIAGAPTVTGAVTNAGATGPTTESFTTNLTQADDYFVGGYLYFTSGVNQGLGCRVSAYKNFNGVITINGTRGSAPGVGDAFSVYPGYSPLKLNLLTGTQPQTRPAWKTTASKGVSAADTYSNTACVFLRALVGSSSGLPQWSWEVMGLFSGSTDANPADIITDLLTHSRRGAGWSASKLNSWSLDASNPASLRTYCQAAGLNLSWAIESQTDAKSLLELLLSAINCDRVWSGGQLRFVPRSDQPVTGNGASYIPSQVPFYDLTHEDFLAPLEVTRVRPADTFNSCPVEYIDRSMDYARNVVDDPDLADIDLRGKVQRAPTSAFPFVMPAASAVMVSRILAQRSLNLRNTYTARLPWRFLLTEPTDFVTLTDPSPISGLSRQPVRIVDWEETVDQSGHSEITIVCEDYPVAVHDAAQYQPQAGDGYRPNVGTPVNTYVLPGGVVSDGQTSRQGMVDNLWPNGNSEQSPSTALLLDPTSPEWADRLNVGASAYSGLWVRQLICPVGSGEVDRFLYLPCSPGDSFYIQAQVKVVNGAAGAPAGVGMQFLDASGASLGYGSTTGYSTTSASWAAVSSSGTAPAQATRVRLYYWAKEQSATATTAQFDGIYARRVVDTAVVADGAVTRQKQAALGQVASSQSYFAVTAISPSWDSATFSTTITTTGRPVLLTLGGDATRDAEVEIYNGATVAASVDGYLQILRDGATVVEHWKFGSWDLRASGGNVSFPLGHVALDTPPAGSHTYTIRGQMGGSYGVMYVLAGKLTAFEL